MKFTITSASEMLRPTGEKNIRTLIGLKKFVKEAYKTHNDMPDEDQEIIISFKKRRIIIYDDYVE